MMNEREKSDPATVAAKSMNEAGQPGEEWMEPRAGTKAKSSQSCESSLNYSALFKR